MAVESALTLGFILFTAFVAWKLSFLSLSGAISAFFVGSSIAIGFGSNGLILIGIFFISSSLFSKYKKKRKSFLSEIHEKGSTRDWAQVIANGGIAALTGLIFFYWSEPIWLIAFAISLASANADTWASELGSLSKKAPRTIKGFKKVETGTSGAISLLGTFAGLLGALLIAMIATYLFQLSSLGFFSIVIFGFAGMLIDTFLGAYLQAEYTCKVCGRHIEGPTHCQEKAILLKGKEWFRNDVVNFMSGLSAVILGILFYISFSPWIS
ncbi:TIGR00297 family protein [Mesobacillus persicus]|uniref:TIGR00297 family protein n=1 Tax=Mesobacillus persicus TaxID=930146 RepID=A0A1H7X5Q3_9BACI|nr:DUF92 domain-containing protein [Mesobacillus persicus]SEM28537.1 TIGR00297 family protein [Mesobacillus persicus]